MPSLTPSLESALERALTAAGERQHEYATLEHLLLALTEDEDAVEVMSTVAQKHGCSIPQVALAWLLAKPVVTSVLIGARKIEQLEDNLKSVDVALDDDDMAKLDGACAPKPQYPGWMIARQGGYRSGAKAGEAPTS